MQGSASLTHLFPFLPKMQLQRRVKIKDHPVRTVATHSNILAWEIPGKRKAIFFPQAGRSWGHPRSPELGGDLKAGGGGEGRVS